MIDSNATCNHPQCSMQPLLCNELSSLVLHFRLFHNAPFIKALLLPILLFKIWANTVSECLFYPTFDAFTVLSLLWDERQIHPTLDTFFNSERFNVTNVSTVISKCYQ